MVVMRWLRSSRPSVAALHNWMLYFGDVLDTAGVIQRLHAGQTAHRSVQGAAAAG